MHENINSIMQSHQIRTRIRDEMRGKSQINSMKVFDDNICDVKNDWSICFLRSMIM